MEWFWLWILFVFIFLLIPVGYGWGYRGWGRPYPTYYRSRRAGTAGTPAYDERRVDVADEETSWGILADVVWIGFAIAVIWLLLAWLLV